MRRVSDAASEFQRRVPTGELNRFFEQVIERQPPPTSAGRAPRLYYITQAETAPPLFVAVSSAPQAIPASYRRFVSNQIRKAFGFESVPILVLYRSRRQRAR
jgi:GTP-binding protein